MTLLLSLLACGQTSTAPDRPGELAGPEVVRRVSALADELAAVRELPEPGRREVRLLDADGWALWQGQTAVDDSTQDHALAAAGLGLVDAPAGLAAHRAGARRSAVWSPALAAVVTTPEGLDGPDMTLAAADSVLARCEPATLSWDARRAAQALEQGRAGALAWQRTLAQAELPTTGLKVDPARVWSPVAAAGPPSPLAQDDDALGLLGTDVVLRMLGAGGWQGVDSACADLPSSTAALLHPDRWQRAQGPADVGPADVPEWTQAGWRQVHADRLGELTLSTWLAHVAQVASETDARTLAAGWRGDAVSVWQRDDEEALRAAWTLSLTPEVRKSLARLLHGRVLVDGRGVEVRPGPGDSLVLLIGGSGDPVVTVREAAAGGAVGVRLATAVDAAAWERSLRLHASPVSAEHGVGRVGTLRFPLDEGWSVATRGLEGQVLSLRHKGSRLKLALYQASTLLVGPPEAAAERVARLVGSQRGLDTPVRLRPVGHCAVAIVRGQDRSHAPLEIRVLAIPTGDSTIIARASYRPGQVDADYHRLVLSLQDTSCHGPLAQRTPSESTAGQ